MIKKDFNYWFVHFFFVFGIIFFATILHELWHYIECNGDWFIAGFYYSKEQWGFGLTLCNKYSGEIVPSIIFIGFCLIGCIIKTKFDKK